MATRVSRINPNVPTTGRAYTAQVRENFKHAYDEITELLNRQTTPGTIDDVPQNPVGQEWVRMFGLWTQHRVDGGTF